MNHLESCNSFLGMDCNCTAVSALVQADAVLQAEASEHAEKSQETEKPRFCKICRQPITLGEIHPNCQQCVYCGEQVGFQVIDSLIREDRDADFKGTDVHKILVYHRPCRENHELNEWKKQPVTISQEVLDILNRKQLMYDAIFNPSDDLSIETNQDLCTKTLRPVFDELNVDQMYAVLMNLQNIAADMNIALGTKGKESARARIQERDKNKVKAVQQFRKDQEKQAADEREESRKRAEKAIQLEAERQNPQLKHQRKAIEAFMKMGIPEEQARKMVIAQEEAQNA